MTERTALLNNIDEVATRIAAADAHHLAMKSASDSAHERMREADEHAKNARAVALLVAGAPFKNIAAIDDVDLIEQTGVDIEQQYDEARRSADDAHAKTREAYIKRRALRGQMKAYIRDLIALGAVGHVGDITPQAS